MWSSTLPFDRFRRGSVPFGKMVSHRERQRDSMIRSRIYRFLTREYSSATISAVSSDSFFDLRIFAGVLSRLADDKTCVTLWTEHVVTFPKRKENARFE